MNKVYKVKGSIYRDVHIASSQFVDILKEELNIILGGSCRHILNGKIYEMDYRCTSDNFIREATKEEIKLCESINNVIHYYRKQG